MRKNHLLLAPLTAVAVLGVAAPSLAADVTVDVTPDFTFAPKTEKVGVGDTVTWTFTSGGHSTTSNAGQALKWNSKILSKGQTFKETFTKPGKYQYYCIPHRDFMKGTIIVGTDKVKKTVGTIGAKVAGSNATLALKLNEAAVVSVKLKGPSKKSVKGKRLSAGKRSVTIKGLKAGSYTATLTLLDDFDNKTTKKKTFKVG
jgi:plastocyanin